MGLKGDKLTQDSVSAAESLVFNLNSIGGISSKRMFGGFGIFHEGKMFDLVDSKGQCFLKGNETNKADFEKKDSFQHSRVIGKKIGLHWRHYQQAYVWWLWYSP